MESPVDGWEADRYVYEAEGMDCFWEHNALHCAKPKQRLLCWWKGVSGRHCKRALVARVLTPSFGLGIPQAVNSGNGLAATDPLTQRSADETREPTWTSWL